MEEYLVLSVALLVAGGLSVAGLIAHQTVWKERRRRRIERRHFRDKLR